MKTICIRTLIAVLGTLFYWLIPSNCWASVDIDGINYNLYANSMTATISYSFTNTDNLIIPATVEYNGSQYTVTGINRCAFQYRHFSSVYIPFSVTNIDPVSFDKCSTDLLIVDADNPKYDSRDNCNAIIETSTNTLIVGFASSVIPNSVTSIGNEAFHFCPGLTTIEIPGSVISIGYLAFEYSRQLTSVSFGNGLTTIGNGAFSNCENLLSVTFPNSLTTIGGGAFDDTPWYNNQPDGMVYAGKVAYRYKGEMPEGTAIVLKEGTLSISDYAFSGCTGLTSIEIPNSVTSIGESAFSGCTGLTSVTIPNSVTNIGSSAFYGCTGLTSITCEGETPVALPNSSVFNKIDRSTCTLYVPLGSKSAYESAAYWNEFKNIVEFEPDTDISALDNAIYVDHIDGRIGGTKVVSVKMKDNYDVCAFQFVMRVPEGVTITGWNLSSKRLSEAVSTPEDNGKILDSGRILSVGYTLNGITYSGDDGEIATVNLSFSEDMEEGSYPIYLTNCHSNGLYDTSDVPMSNIKATLTLEDYMVGDANGDGQVLIGDVTALLNYIVGRPTSSFYEKSADVNGDGVILVGDVTALLNIIVNQVQY